MTDDERRDLSQVTRIRTAQQAQVRRAQTLPAYVDGEALHEIGDRLHVGKAVKDGLEQALEIYLDRAGRGTVRPKPKPG